jgi:hypothetical protein
MKEELKMTAPWPECFDLPFQKCEYGNCPRRGIFIDETHNGVKSFKCSRHSIQPGSSKIGMKDKK